MMLYNKTIYFHMITMSLLATSLLTLFINNLMTIWFLLEMNNFIFLFYMSLYMKNKKMIFLYFFIQISASLMIMLFLLINIHSPQSINYFTSTFLLFSLLLKLGIPPLHSWMPLISIYMNWDMITIFLTLQKIIPFIMMSMIDTIPTMQLFIITLCMIIPPMMMINMNNFKKLLVYSSINQMGWMILLIMISPIMWLMYMIMYSLTLFIITNMIKIKNIKPVLWFKMSPLTKLIIMFMMLNMSGLPPLTFFIMKWYTIFLFISTMNFNILIIMMLLSSLILMYIYINMIMKTSLTHSEALKLINYSHKTTNQPLNFIYMTLLLISMIIFLH